MGDRSPDRFVTHGHYVGDCDTGYLKCVRCHSCERQLYADQTPAAMLKALRMFEAEHGRTACAAFEGSTWMGADGSAYRHGDYMPLTESQRHGKVPAIGHKLPEGFRLR